MNRRGEPTPCLDLPRARALLAGALAELESHRAMLHALTGCRRCAAALAAALQSPAETRGPSSRARGGAPRTQGLDERRERQRRDTAATLLAVLGGPAADPATLPGLADLPLPARIEAHRLRSWEARYRDPGEMVLHARQANALAERQLAARECGGIEGLADQRCRTAAALANALRVGGEHREAARALERARAHHGQGSGDPVLLAEILPIEASLAADRGDFAAAQAALDQALAICASRRLDARQAQILVQKGTYLGYAGETRAAISCLAKGLARLDARQHPDLALAARFNLASYLADAGEPREARRHAWGLASRFAERGETLNSARVRWLEAKIHAALGHADRAERDYRAAQKGLATAPEPVSAGLVTLELALFLHHQGRAADAVAAAAQATALFQGLTLGREATAALALLQNLLAHEGQPAAELTAALATFTRELGESHATRAVPAG